MNVLRPATRRALPKGTVKLLPEQEKLGYYVFARNNVKQKCVTNVMGSILASNKIM
jgi:hypothetical protein